jgi:hypothetical protein
VLQPHIVTVLQIAGLGVHLGTAEDERTARHGPGRHEPVIIGSAPFPTWSVGFRTEPLTMAVVPISPSSRPWNLGRDQREVSRSH